MPQKRFPTERVALRLVALREAGRAIGEGEGVGEVAKKNCKGRGDWWGSRCSNTGRRQSIRTEGSIKEAVAGRVFQPRQQQEFIEKTGAKILSKVDTKGIGTYDDLSRTLESNISKGLKHVDETLAKSPDIVPLKSFERVVETEVSGREAEGIVELRPRCSRRSSGALQSHE